MRSYSKCGVGVGRPGQDHVRGRQVDSGGTAAVEDEAWGRGAGRPPSRGLRVDRWEGRGGEGCGTWTPSGNPNHGKNKKLMKRGAAGGKPGVVRESVAPKK